MMQKCSNRFSTWPLNWNPSQHPDFKRFKIRIPFWRTQPYDLDEVGRFWRLSCSFTGFTVLKHFQISRPLRRLVPRHNGFSDLPLGPVCMVSIRFPSLPFVSSDTSSIYQSINQSINHSHRMMCRFAKSNLCQLSHLSASWLHTKSHLKQRNKLRGNSNVFSSTLKKGLNIGLLKSGLQQRHLNVCGLSRQYFRSATATTQGIFPGIPTLLLAWWWTEIKNLLGSQLDESNLVFTWFFCPYPPHPTM